jgi:hypothetical protein
MLIIFLVKQTVCCPHIQDLGISHDIILWRIKLNFSQLLVSNDQDSTLNHKNTITHPQKDRVHYITPELIVFRYTN